MANHVKIKTNIPKIYGNPRLYRDTVHIFTDGSCERIKAEGGKARGGWAAILLFNDVVKEIYGGQHDTTNNEMELMAIFKGLEALKQRHAYPVHVYSDSQYCINSISVWWKGWIKRDWHTADGKPVKNLELIKAIVDLQTDAMVFSWLKGHSGIKYNERADELAGLGRKELGHAKK